MQVKASLSTTALLTDIPKASTTKHLRLEETIHSKTPISSSVPNSANGTHILLYPNVLKQTPTLYSSNPESKAEIDIRYTSNTNLDSKGRIIKNHLLRLGSR